LVYDVVAVSNLECSNHFSNTHSIPRCFLNLSDIRSHLFLFHIQLISVNIFYIFCLELMSNGFLCVGGYQPFVQHPTSRIRVSLFVWHLPFDLTGKGGPTNRYATAGMTLYLFISHRPHQNKVYICLAK